MKKIILTLSIFLPFMLFSQTVFINEIHYDNSGADINEGIEIAGPSGTDLSPYSLVLYNGSGGGSYNTINLSGSLPNQENGFGTTFFSASGLQNGSPDGVALVESGTVVQFLSYEGSFTATDGPAMGLISEDIGVSEPGSTPIGNSLQLTGTGTTYLDFSWASDSTNTFNSINLDQTFGSPTPIVFINEFHYDNSGGDVNEGIEVAGTAGTDLTGWTLYLYNGSNGTLYNSVNLGGILPDQNGGYGTLSFLVAGIQNGAPDGIALADPSDSIIQFLSYEGVFSATDGPANGLSSEDIGISENGSTPTDFSLQLTGTGLTFEDFTWIAAVSTFGQVNTDQTFGEGPTPPEPTASVLFINEIHYDNTGGDQNEGIEVAGTAGLDLNGWSIVFYNGSGGSSYNTVSLNGILSDQQNGFGATFFSISGIQNGSPDGVALVNPMDSVIQFLSYEGSFTAVGGPADGLSSEDIGVSEPGSTPVGFSLQLEGEGSSYEDFTWAAPAISTFDAINTNQQFGAPTPTVFINEIHYDNEDGDTGEAVEIVGSAGLDLTGWSLVLYNGNGGSSYNTISLSGLLANQDNGFGTLSFAISGIQNGAPDGMALVDPMDSVIQFLSYEGSFIANNGPASGILSEDIGVFESGSTPIGFSLQLEGTGQTYADFSWTAPQANTFDAINTNQSFGEVITPPTSDTVTVAQARALPFNTEVVLRAVLTASDQFGGPAYLQDSTAGIALFDPIIHGDGAFNIGDELLISASISEFSNQIQLSNVDTVILLDTGVFVTPQVVTLDQLINFEGQLVTINDVSFDIGSGILFPNTNYDISDSTATQEVRIDGNTNLVGRNRPDGPTSITGVVGRFQTFVQILPRFIPDLPESTPFVPGGSDIPFDQTLDVATWNMEFFGTTISGFGPSDIQLQFDNAFTVLSDLNADIIALQEVSNDSLLQVLVDSLPGYKLICSDVFSRSFETPDPNNPFPPQKLCYMIDTTVVNVVSDRVIFDEFYTLARLGLINDLDSYPTTSGASSFWSSGRLPYQLIADVTIDGSTERVNVINIHAKSGSSTNDLERRVFDNTVLKDSLDAQYPNDQIILLGDYNDNVTASIGGGPSTYQVILEDTASFRAITESLSTNEIPTFIGGSGSTIDHITISNELEDEVVEGSEKIYFPFNDIDNFEGTTSDHLPVISRFEIVPSLPSLETTVSDEQTVFFGFTPQSTATLEVEAIGGLAPYSYSWSTGDTTASIEVFPENTTLYSVVITDSRGESISDTTQVNVVDVTCQAWGQTKVQVCFRGRSYCVSEYVAERLLSKGGSLGECNGEDQVTISNVTLFPNPFRDKLNIGLDATGETSLNIKISSFFRGKRVFNEDVDINAGNNQITLELDHLRSGFYFMKIRNAETGKLERVFTLYKK